MSAAALLLMFFQFASANGQTVDTQCVRTGPVFNCQSKLDEKSKNTERDSQETWNRIYENLRRADDAEDRIRRSQQRIDQAEENSNEIYREYMISAISENNRKKYDTRVFVAVSEGRCTDALFLSIVWDDDDKFKYIDKECTKSSLDLRSRLRSENGFPDIYTATMAIIEPSVMSENRGYTMLMDLIENNNDPAALFAITMLFEGGVFPFSASKKYMYVSLSDYFYRKNINLYPSYYREQEPLTRKVRDFHKKLLSKQEIIKSDEIIEYCTMYGMKKCRDHFGLFP